MNRTLLTLLLSATLAAPALADAQTHSPVTRSQVKSELQQLRAAGYSGDTDASYPTQLVSAEKEAAAKTNGYGSSPNGISAAGAPSLSEWAGESNARTQP